MASILLYFIDGAIWLRCGWGTIGPQPILRHVALVSNSADAVIHSGVAALLWTRYWLGRSCQYNLGPEWQYG